MTFLRKSSGGFEVMASDGSEIEIAVYVKIFAAQIIEHPGILWRTLTLDLVRMLEFSRARD